MPGSKFISRVLCPSKKVAKCYGIKLAVSVVAPQKKVTGKEFLSTQVNKSLSRYTGLSRRR